MVNRRSDTDLETALIGFQPILGRPKIEAQIKINPFTDAFFFFFFFLLNMFNKKY